MTHAVNLSRLLRWLGWKPHAPPAQDGSCRNHCFEWASWSRACSVPCKKINRGVEGHCGARFKAQGHDKIELAVCQHGMARFFFRRVFSANHFRLLARDPIVGRVFKRRLRLLHGTCCAVNGGQETPPAHLPHSTRWSLAFKFSHSSVASILLFLFVPRRHTVIQSNTPATHPSGMNI